VPVRRPREHVPVPENERPRGWLPKPEFDYIFSRVARLCVEVVALRPEGEVLLSMRDIPPNVGAWHLPGGTVLFGEPVTEAVRRVARRELGAEVEVGELLGYIEYPSHYENGLDSPVGLAFRTTLIGAAAGEAGLPEGCAWFSRLPDGLYEEQRRFLADRLGFPS
jgi:ADP-ribose pyrophosphatase YjhB (NUDIX family)